MVVIALALYAAFQWQKAEQALAGGNFSHYELYVAEQERDEAISRELAANAMLNLQTDPELSLLLAIQAVSISDTTESLSTLKNVISISEDIKTEELLAKARGRLTRTWSVEECIKYLYQESCPQNP